MVKGISVGLLPAVAYEGRHEQKQRALGLVEVGHHTGDGAIAVARSYHKLSFAVQIILAVACHPFQYISIGFGIAHSTVVERIGVPLRHMHGVEVRIMPQLYAKPVEALQRTHAGSAHSHTRRVAVGNYMPKVIGGDVYLLHMHLMVAYEFAAHRLECTGTHM